jgi:hypothetical protein
MHLGALRIAISVALLTAGVSLGPAVNAQAASSKTQPVMVGGEPDLDACGGQGEIANLSAKGFASLRSAPTTSAKELARLKNGATIYFCDEAPGWVGVVVASGNINCGVGTPIEDRVAYRGRCKSGWVSAKYATLLAG